MKQVLVLGAGLSSSYLIHHLLELATDRNWFVTVADLDLGAAEAAVGQHPRGSAIQFDVNDATMRAAVIEKSNVVINMLLPAHQHLVAWDCVAHGRHMLSVSYRDADLRALDQDAHRKGVLLLSELGLDPGIDHMSAMSMIERVRREGGNIVGFRSYGSGIPAPDQAMGPLRYAITWNPRNVAMAGEAGAQYMRGGKIKLVAFHNVFDHTWPVEVPGVGTLEAYANRDSLSYMGSFGLDGVETMIRGTLRYPGWSETWAQIVRLGLPNETLRIGDLGRRTYREVVEMFLPLSTDNPHIEQRLARFLRISPTGQIMENLRWLGLLSDEPIGCEGETTAEMLTHVLKQKLPLRDGARDMVILQHEFEVARNDGTGELALSTMVVRGDPHPQGFTAMAKTVGLPTAIAVKLLLDGEISLTGCRIPTHPSIYEAILREIAREGLVFKEASRPLSDARRTTNQERE